MKFLLGAATAALFAIPAVAGVTVTYEDAGVQNSTAGFDFVGVETFEGVATGSGQSFGTTFGGSAISGTYSNVQIDSANQFGSAGGTGNHAVTFAGVGYDLSLSTARPEGINYFGYWLSALDRGNKLEFFRDGALVYSFTPDAVDAAVGACPNGSNAFCGNPTLPFLGQNGSEPYVFVNVYFTGGTTIDMVRFFEAPSVGGYESDNHTVGYFNTIGGNTVPEPATWGMMILGFGLVGLASRRRNRMESTLA